MYRAVAAPGLVVIIDNRMPFRIGQPEVARDLGVVFVDLAVTMLPIIILAARNAYALDEVAGGNLSFVGIISHVINHLVTNVRLDP